MKKQLNILKYILLSSIIISTSVAASKKLSITNSYGNTVPTDNIITFKIATLSGDNQVPAVATSATGSVAAIYDLSSKVLSYNIKYTGLTPTMVHIHVGYNGTNGAV